MADAERTNMDADMKLDSTIIKMAEEYASCDRRSKEINDSRANIRDNVEKLGIDPLAFQHAVKMVKHMSPGERADYQSSVNRVLKAISERQDELFPAEAEKIRKRMEREAASEAGKKAAADAKTDSNPRSDPKSGGAGAKVVPLKGKGGAKPAEAKVSDTPKAPLGGAANADEQQAGDEVLKTANGPLSAAAAAASDVPPEPPADESKGWPDDVAALQHKQGETIN